MFLLFHRKVQKPLKPTMTAKFLQHPKKKKLVNKQHQTPLNNINTMEDQIFVSSFLFYETSNTICRKIDVYQFQRVIKEDNPLFSNPKKNRYHSKLEHPTNKKN